MTRVTLAGLPRLGRNALARLVAVGLSVVLEKR
jgi:hypothetical protein